MVKKLLLAFWMALALAAYAQPGPPPLFEQAIPTRANPVVQRFVGDVAYLPDVTYKTVPGWRPLKLDLYVPPASAQLHGVVLWVHGGGFEIGHPRSDWTWGDWRPVLAALAARGYVVAGVTYRLSSEAPFPAAYEDVQDAVRFMRSHAQLWGADGQKVIAWGLSAGGGLVALAGTSCTNGQPNGSSAPAGQVSPCVQGVVDWFGPSFFDGLANQPPSNRFLGCVDHPCSDQTVKAVSALHQVHPGMPPYLIMQGAADPMIAPEHSERLANALRSAGVGVDLVIYPGLGHGFDGASPEKLKEILQTTFDGIDRMSGKISKH